jgi:hypothetical protein
VLGWAQAAAGGGRVAWAIEGTRSYGAGLARYLAAAGEQVAEIDGSHCLGKRRAGKSDAIDAVRAARELLARPHAAQMRADGDREALRLLLIGRDHAVQAASAARTALASILVTRLRVNHAQSLAGPPRIGALAAPAEILVSTTVKDLVPGSELRFKGRGIHALKGVPGKYALSQPNRTCESPLPAVGRLYQDQVSKRWRQDLQSRQAHSQARSW